MYVYIYIHRYLSLYLYIYMYMHIYLYVENCGSCLKLTFQRPPERQGVDAKKKPGQP